MATNNVVSGEDLPEMYLLAKDHKNEWSPESSNPVPTRPVVSGNCAVNTHLSELLSEIIEPVALQYKGAEIQSSEEGLAMLNNINKKSSDWCNGQVQIGTMVQRVGGKQEVTWWDVITAREKKLFESGKGTLNDRHFKWCESRRCMG